MTPRLMFPPEKTGDFWHDLPILIEEAKREGDRAGTDEAQALLAAGWGLELPRLDSAPWQ